MRFMYVLLFVLLFGSGASLLYRGSIDHSPGRFWTGGLGTQLAIEKALLLHGEPWEKTPEKVLLFFRRSWY